MKITTLSDEPPLPVSGSGGYFMLVTPGAAMLDPGGVKGRPCDAIYVSTDMAQVTGKRGGIGTSDVATQSPPLAAGIPHALSFWSITAITAGSVWAIWYQAPI